MQNEENRGAFPEQPAEAPPQLTPEPEPVRADDPVLGAIAKIGVGVVAIGGLVFLLGPMTGPTCGARHSVKVEWETRQAEIERAMAADHTAVEGIQGKTADERDE